MSGKCILVTVSFLAITSSLLWCGTLLAHDPPHHRCMKKGKPWQIDIHAIPVNFNGSTSPAMAAEDLGRQGGFLRQNGVNGRGAPVGSEHSVRGYCQRGGVDCTTAMSHARNSIIRAVLLRFF